MEAFLIGQREEYAQQKEKISVNANFTFEERDKQLKALRKKLFRTQVNDFAAENHTCICSHQPFLYRWLKSMYPQTLLLGLYRWLKSMPMDCHQVSLAVKLSLTGMPEQSAQFLGCFVLSHLWRNFSFYLWKWVSQATLVQYAIIMHQKTNQIRTRVTLVNWRMVTAFLMHHLMLIVQRLVHKRRRVPIDGRAL